MNKNQRLAWVAVTLIYFLSACLAHLQFSLWLVRGRTGSQGWYAYAEAMPALVVIGLIALVLWLVNATWNQPDRITRLIYWAFWGLCVFLCDRFLTFSINEYAHYPQYGILAWLFAKCIDPDRTGMWVGRTVFWVTLMGAADECLQYLWITTSYSDYLDFNDFLVNLLAASGGAMVYYARTPTLTKQFVPITSIYKPEVWTIFALVLALGLAISADRLVMSPAPGERIAPGGIQANKSGNVALYLQRSDNFYGSWQKGPRRGLYKVLPPIPGLLLVLITGSVFFRFGRSTKARKLW